MIARSNEGRPADVTGRLLLLPVQRPSSAAQATLKAEQPAHEQKRRPRPASRPPSLLRPVQAASLKAAGNVADHQMVESNDGLSFHSEGDSELTCNGPRSFAIKVGSP